MGHLPLPPPDFMGRIPSLAALFSVAFVSASAAAMNAGSGLEDVQVGERDLQTRIALICDGPCQVDKRGGLEFQLNGVTSEMNLDLAARSRNVAGFVITPDAEGSILSLKARRALEYANVKPCSISGRAATCIDLFFSGEQKAAAAPAPAKLAPAPGLRESAPDRLTRFAGLAPPERLAPPEAARLASVQPVRREPPAERKIETGAKPIAAAPAREPARFNYAAKVKALIGKDLTTSYCAAARGVLQADPWALEEMVDVGLCTAAAGNGAEADEILARLLEYTPDNYEAYVGRALIALQAGEKSVARRYFQSALDAPPPIEESSAIVAAMQGL
ncbi:MAG: hypothetical protein R3C58_14555 [Parvularculaceae bacterium]